MPERAAGENVMVRREENILVITVDLNQNCGRTSTGKSVMVGKTGGWATLPTECDPAGRRLKLNLNLIRMDY